MKIGFRGMFKSAACNVNSRNSETSELDSSKKLSRSGCETGKVPVAGVVFHARAADSSSVGSAFFA